MAQDPFAALRQEYLESAAQRRTDVERLSPLAATDSSARAELRKIAHNLRGSGGFYGFHAISEAATLLEELLIALEQGEAKPTSDVREAAERLCDEIRNAAQKPQGPS